MKEIKVTDTSKFQQYSFIAVIVLLLSIAIGLGIKLYFTLQEVALKPNIIDISTDFYFDANVQTKLIQKFKSNFHDFIILQGGDVINNDLVISKVTTTDFKKYKSEILKTYLNSQLLRIDYSTNQDSRTLGTYYVIVLKDTAVKAVLWKANKEIAQIKLDNYDENLKPEILINENSNEIIVKTNGEIQKYNLSDQAKQSNLSQADYDTRLQIRNTLETDYKWLSVKDTLFGDNVAFRLDSIKLNDFVVGTQNIQSKSSQIVRVNVSDSYRGTFERIYGSFDIISPCEKENCQLIVVE